MTLNPYLAFNGNCEAAFTFYNKVLGGKIAMMLKVESVEDRDHHFERSIPRSGTHAGERAVNARGAVLDRDHRVGDAERQVVVRVHPLPGSGIEHVVERAEALGDFVHQQRPCGIDHIDTMCAVGFHQLGLIGEQRYA